MQILHFDDFDAKVQPFNRSTSGKGCLARQPNHSADTDVQVLIIQGLTLGPDVLCQSC